MTDCKVHPWHTLDVYSELALQLKEDDELPDFIKAIVKNVSAYEKRIKTAWEDLKKEPTLSKAKEFIAMMMEDTKSFFAAILFEILDISSMSPEQEEFLNSETEKQNAYWLGSLFPTLQKYIEEKKPLESLDYRTIILYAGAAWSFGFFGYVLFDGFGLRKKTDLFLFSGPDDENTCSGPRGCDQHVGKIYTVQQILDDDIIPGHLQCLTNCRHMLVPVESLPEE